MEHVKIPTSSSPRAHLLARLSWRGELIRLRTAVIYLHGFPDMAVLPPAAAAVAADGWASRFPRKMCAALLEGIPGCLFVAFNAAGVPGSDAEVSFEQKTLSRELADAVDVVRFVRQRYLGGGSDPWESGMALSSRAAARPPLREAVAAGARAGARARAAATTAEPRAGREGDRRQFLRSCVAAGINAASAASRPAPSAPVAPIHVLGLSTGAIIASLLRGSGCDRCLGIIAVAGLLDLRLGLEIDFDAEQIAQAKSQGWCSKDFWLPVAAAAAAAGGGVAFCKTGLRLGAQYLEEYTNGRLDIGAAVRASGGPRPKLLVIHGTKDRSVPVAHGQALFDAAAEPKELLLINGGTHLLTNTKRFKKAARAVVAFVQSSLLAS